MQWLQTRGQPSTYVGELWPGLDTLLPGFVWEAGSTMSKIDISPDILGALQRLSGLLTTDTSLHDALETVAKLCAESIPGCDSAGVTLRSDGHDATAAASDDYALEIDTIQYEANQGPCVTALEESKFIHIDAVSEETRWPDFCARAARQGFKSSLSFPLKNNGATGALNIYSTRERAFAENSISIGYLMASQATVALQNARILLASKHLAEELQEALKSRDLIGQAKGILMEREGVSDPGAFEMLKTMSQTTNVKLREVARRLVDETVNRKPH